MQAVAVQCLDAGPDAHYVIAAYDHWAADSAAARLVLRHVLDRYCEWNRPENRRPLDLYPGTYREVFSHRLGGARLLRPVHFAAPVDEQPVGGAGSLLVSRQMDVRFELYRAASGSVPQLAICRDRWGRQSTT